jgi:hypothetical protein
MSQIETWALDDDEIAECVSWLDPSEGIAIDEHPDQYNLVGELFSLDGGPPPTQILGSHPACTRADTVLEAQGKEERTNKDNSNTTSGNGAQTNDFTNDVLANSTSQLRLENPDVTTMDPVEIKSDLTDVGMLEPDDPMCINARKILEKPVVSYHDIPAGSEVLRYLNGWRQATRVRAALDNFSHYRGTFCSRVECYNPATDAVTLAVEMRTFARLTDDRYQGDFMLVDNNGPASCEMKATVPMDVKWMRTDERTPVENDITIIIHPIAITSATTGTNARIRLLQWMEDAEFRLPVAQGRVDVTRFQGPDVSLKQFQKTIGDDQIERLLTDKVASVPTGTWDKTTAAAASILSYDNLLDLFPLGSPQRYVLEGADRVAYGYVEVMFHVTKTSFHRGKLWISLGRTLDDARKNTGVVWDVAESNQFKVRIPWTNLDQMNRCYNTSVERDAAFLTVAVDTPLTCPDSVSDLVPIHAFTSLVDMRFGAFFSSATTQGLIEPMDCPTFTFPNLGNNMPGDGVTLREAMETMTGGPRAYKVLDPAAGNNFKLQPITGDNAGFSGLLDFFSFWAGSIEYVIQPLGSTSVFTDGTGIPVNYLHTATPPKHVVVAKGMDELPTTTFGAGITSHTGLTEVTDTKDGVVLVTHPVETLGRIYDDGRYNTGCYDVTTMTSGAAFDTVMTMWRIGKNAKFGVRN